MRRFHKTENATIEERFWDKVLKTPTCWLWQGQKRGTGYGGFSLNGTQRILAHRMAWKLTFGSIPEGLCICHACDNILCVNPNHLWLGTHKANMVDMNRKGRNRALPYLAQPHPRGPKGHPLYLKGHKYGNQTTT